MKIKLKIVMCLLVASTLAIAQEISLTPQQTNFSINNLIPTPLVEYQKMLSDMAYNLMIAFLYKQTTPPNAVHEPQKPSTSESIIELSKTIAQVEEASTKEIISELSREQALEAMKEITTKVFDLKDPDLLGKHLVTLKKLCEHLDPQIDQKTIAAITFLIENQHKAGMSHLPFWIQAIKKHEFETSIPMKPEIQKKPGTEKLGALNKKMALQIEHLKKEQAAALTNSTLVTV